ncbi:hypothetical protein BJY01DRAFT_257019 [Aspergillus pseudoustus]|uniref:Amine oxidase n=1 Tax=Aspergillus pseudoustus TaxID=1810923 RepID=A0ABR4JN21_9EURO
MHLATLFSPLVFSGSVAGHVAQARLQGPTCTRTTVAILGGGMAGVTAAQTLANASITDFLLLEYQDRLGGRVMHTDFGQDPSGEPYVVEFGANWIQGLGSETTENPVWALAKKHNISNTVSDYDSILTYNETGYVDYSAVLDEYAVARHRASLHAGEILTDNLQDMTARSGLALAGWRPRRNDMAAQAVEWWNWDWEGASAPETSSFVFGVAAENLTFNQFGSQNNLVVDPRGYSSIITGEADTFLMPNDPRLRLNTQVTSIEHSEHGVVIHTADGSCVSAAYAIATFSLGVLQNHAVSFDPALPDWKRTAIEKFNMGTYTKIFMQFPETFWPAEEAEYFLYASPTTRGWYPVFQSMDKEGFLPGSHVLFVTVVESHAYRVELQSESQTQAEIMAVLREMFPDRTVPDPVAFTYPRWTQEPWAYGSYSNWPAGTTLEMHQNLRANVGRLWFAGEATSAQYFGFLHGALFEGREVGENIVRLLKKEEGECARDTQDGEEGEGECRARTHYSVLHGTTPLGAYSGTNGWGVNSTSIQA